MKKPSLKGNFLNSQSHATMELWAREHTAPVLEITTVYKDGSTGIDAIEPHQKEVEYKTPDKDTYAVSVDTRKYSDSIYTDDKPMTPKQVVKCISEWYTAKGIEFSTITYRLIPQ